MPLSLSRHGKMAYGRRDVIRLRDVEKTAIRKSVPQQLHAVSEAKKRIFGCVCGMPGEEQWLNPLHGRERVKWYWPCKYLFQNFHVGQYFHMQALRYSPRSTHPSIHELADCLELCWRKRKAVRTLLERLDRRSFEENQSLQDLYAMYRTLCKDKPLSFPVNPHIWTDSGFNWMDLPTPPGTNAGGEEPEEAEAPERPEAVKLSVRDLPYLSLRQEYPLWGPVTHLPPTSGMSLTSRPQEYHGSSSSTGADLRRDRMRNEDSRSSRRFRTQADVDLTADTDGAAEGRHTSSKSRSTVRSTRWGQRSPVPSEATTAAPASEARRVKRLNVGFTRPPDADEEKSLLERQQEGRRMLESALGADEELATYHGTKHHFFDPLFRRRRLSFLDRFARDRIKGEIARQVGTRLYVQHPDHKETWPDNKGLVTRKWPSPYH